MRTPRLASYLFAAMMLTTITKARAQQPPPPPAQPQKPAPETPTTRLAHAKSVMFMRTHGNNIPFDTIKSTLEGWGRYTIVDKAEDADLVVQVATYGGDS